MVEECAKAAGRKRTWIELVALLAVLGGPAPAAAELPVEEHLLGTLGGANSWATDMDSRGRVVGAAEDTFRRARPVLWEERGAIVRNLAFDIGDVRPFMKAVDITESGFVAVVACDAQFSFACESFLWQDGHVWSLGDGMVERVNEAGEAAGQLYGETRGVLFWDAAHQRHELGRFGAHWMTIRGLNHRGQLLLHQEDCYGGLGECASFVWANGMLTEIRGPNGGWTEARSLNTHGVVLAFERRLWPNGTTFLWQDGRISQLDGLPCDARYPASIDDDGRALIFGVPRGDPDSASAPAPDERAFVWLAGDVTVLENGDPESAPLPGQITSTGDVLGESCYLGCEGYTTPVLWRNGVITFLSGVTSMAVALNARGEIAGTLPGAGENWEAGGRAVMWTVPLPSSTDPVNTDPVHDPSRCSAPDPFGDDLAGRGRPDSRGRGPGPGGDLPRRGASTGPLGGCAVSDSFHRAPTYLIALALLVSLGRLRPRRRR